VALAGPLDDAVARPGSYAEVGVFLPMEVLQEAAVLAVPAELSGRVQDWAGGALEDDVITWSASPRDFSLGEAASKLQVSAMLTGSARILGRINLLIGTASDEGTVEIAAAMQALVGLRITPDYEFDLSLEPTVDVSDATASIFGISFSVRGMLTDWLESQQGTFERDVEALVNEAVDLRAALGESWARLCRREELAFDGARRVLMVNPVALVMAQPEVSAAGVQIRVGVRAETRLVNGEAPGCPALPARMTLQE